MTKHTAFLSDLHWGDGSAADVFDVGTRRPRFRKLLDYFQDNDAQPFFLGDLGDCLIAHSSAIIEHWDKELTRLASMDAVYVAGNHDAAWGTFELRALPRHRFFDRTFRDYVRITIAGRKFWFVHGHEADRYCRKPYPDADAITALISARRRRRHAQARASGRYYVDLAPTMLEKVGSLVRRIMGKPTRLVETIAGVETLRKRVGADVVCWGHTHVAGRIGTRNYNDGCWCGEEGTETFGLIDNDSGEVRLYRWTLDCEAVEIDTELRAA